jgi:hypothetical protein
MVVEDERSAVPAQATGEPEKIPTDAKGKDDENESAFLAILRSLVKVVFILITHAFIFLIYVVSIVPGTVISSLFPPGDAADKNFYILGYSGTFYLMVGLGTYLYITLMK